MKRSDQDRQQVRTNGKGERPLKRTSVSTVKEDGIPQAVATLDITVLAGGPSLEREVSLNSGRMIRDALVRLDHRVTLRDIMPDDLAALDVPADVIFIALHGEFGEDGQLQRILEQRRLTYTGSGPEASALVMDKVGTKARLIEHGIPTPGFDVIKPARVATAVRSFSHPVVVKPRDSGSSVDTFIADDAHEFQAALNAVVGNYGVALVEDYIAGPELTVGILQDRALPPCEIRTRRRFYDYQAKYVDDDTQYLFDIDLPRDLLSRVQTMSEAANQALGCRDFARVDWMIDRHTLEPYIIEVNTIPGFTSHSLLPKAAARVGISYEQLCQTIIEAGLNRARRRAD